MSGNGVPVINDAGKSATGSKDYLSKVTRRTKSRLLIISSVLVIADFYKLQFVKIPILDIVLSQANSQAALYILVFIGLYLAVMFICFLYKDKMNIGINKDWESFGKDFPKAFDVSFPILLVALATSLTFGLGVNMNLTVIVLNIVAITVFCLLATTHSEAVASEAADKRAV